MSKNDELSWNYGKMIIFGDIDFDGYPKIQYFPTKMIVYNGGNRDTF